MLDFALAHDGPVAIRYPKAIGRNDRPAQRAPIELGRAEVLDWGHDGMILACGTLLGNAVKAAALLRAEGLDVGVINARFIKPLDTETILRAVENSPFVVTVEEAALVGGFGSAVLEAAADAGQCRERPPAGHSRSLHRARRAERTAGRLGPDAAGIAIAARQMAARRDIKSHDRRRVS